MITFVATICGLVYFVEQKRPARPLSISFVRGFVVVVVRFDAEQSQRMVMSGQMEIIEVQV